MYTPDLASTGVKGVGFLNVTLALTLSDTAHDDIVGQIRTQFPDVWIRASRLCHLMKEASKS